MTRARSSLALIAVAVAVAGDARSELRTPELDMRSGFRSADDARRSAGGVRAIYQDRFTYVPSPVDERALRMSTFQVNYTGFSAEAQAAFQAAVNIWSALLISSVPIVVDATFASLPGNVLGFAGAGQFVDDFPNQPIENTFFPIGTANALAGRDLLPGIGDIVATFSSTPSWYFGTDGNPPAGQFDFVTVVLHELAHGLGLLASADATGTVASLNVPPFIYDRHVQAGGVNIQGGVPNSSAVMLAAFTGNDLFFNLPPTTALRVTAPAKLYAPDPFEPGASVSHLDEALFGPADPNSLIPRSFIRPKPSTAPDRSRSLCSRIWAGRL